MESTIISAKQFTNNWFNIAAPTWEPYTTLFKDISNKRFLEIGSYEGRSTLYIAENFCTGAGSYIDAVDTWEGGADQINEPLEGLYSRFTYNLKKEIDSNIVRIHKGLSSDILMNLVQKVRSGDWEKYDFIYIDASHIAKDVLMDTILCWELLKNNGIMIFDDYTWGQSYPDYFRPKPAIDAFLICYSTMYELLHKEYQVHIRKLCDKAKSPLEK